MTASRILEIRIFTCCKCTYQSKKLILKREEEDLVMCPRCEFSLFYRWKTEELVFRGFDGREIPFPISDYKLMYLDEGENDDE